MATLGVKEQVEVSVNGERAALLDLNVRMSETDPKNSLDIRTPPLHITAGPQRISAAFIQRFDGPVDDLLVVLLEPLPCAQRPADTTLPAALRTAKRLQKKL